MKRCLLTWRFSVVMVFTAVLSACSVNPPQQPEPLPEVLPPLATPKPPLDNGVKVAKRPIRLAAVSAPQARQKASASEKLASRAAVAERDGKLDIAAAYLERALRISPKDASLWHQLARVHLADDEPKRAEALASKSNSLASDNRLMLRQNWKLIADAREKRGAKRAAAAARRKAKSL